MRKFTQIDSRAAWLDEDNVDTDAIFPARFLLLLERETLGRCAFFDRRYDADGRECPEFILNRPDFRSAAILVAGRNFGCGSSREHAVWTLLGHGIRCVIATSFGEIFRANCIKNGLLPIQADEETGAALMRDARALESFHIDLHDRIVRTASRSVRFEIEPDERDALLNGWDEAEIILQMHGADIRGFETTHRQSQPWLFGVDIAPHGQPRP